MRVLVTGGSGFVGRHLVRALRQRLPAGASVVATSRRREVDPELGALEPLDITDRTAIDALIHKVAPTQVVHLAASSISLRASDVSVGAFAVNVLGTLNLARAILSSCRQCRLISVGSGLVYGGAAAYAAFSESSPLAPRNDYAVSKAAADLALGAAASEGLKVIRLRPFNHTGPGQSEAFVVPAFAAQIARIEAGLQSPEIVVGNLDAERDFLDVRDVVSAYIGVILQAASLPPGQVLNIASGVPRSIKGILDDLLALSPAPISVRVDPARLHASDTPVSIGDPAAARRLLNWVPRYDFTTTLADVLDYWRRRVGRADMAEPRRLQAR